MIKEEVGEFLTCKFDQMFKTVVIDEKNPRILEAMLSCILGGKPKIISWPSTVIPNTIAKEKAKNRDLVVVLDGTYINLELVTGHGKQIRSQLFTYLASMWKQNILQGEKYDTKTLFLQIVLQFGLNPNKPLMKEHKMQAIDPETKEIEIWVENLKTIEINMERLKKLWYDNSIKDIKKYKYLMMIDMDLEELNKLKTKESDEIVEEFTEKVSNLNKNLNFINSIGKEKEREYMFNTAVELAREEGLEKGFENGCKNTRLENVRSLLDMGVTLETLKEGLNLTKEEIEELGLK